MSIFECALILGLIFLIIVGALILKKQKELDEPFGGTLIVEKNEGEPSLIYFQAMKDPGTFTDGDTLKLVVKVVDSQRKQH